MKRSNQKGAALIFALILVLVLSVMGVSIMFLSQSETWASMNYRLLTQARYGAEAGVNATANYLVNTYTPPGTTGDPITAYDITKSPVTLAGTTTPVVLSSISGTTSQYPLDVVKSAFSSASQGSVTAGNTTVSYTSKAELLSMRQVNVYGSTTPATIQTWKITSQGAINGVRNAQVEVSAIIEKQVTPMFAYAAFADFNGCNALGFGGGGSTDSYDSSNISYTGAGKVVTQNFSGNVGTNGNLSASGATTVINGSLSTPRTGVGTCSSSSISAMTGTGGATVTGGLVQLPQPIIYPVPAAPNPLPPVSNQRLQGSDKNCGGISGCTGSNGNFTLAPGSYGNLTLNAGAIVHLTAGTYNVNSLQMQSTGSQIVIDSGPIILNLAGQSIANNQAVLDFTGGSLVNSSLNPANFQIQYAGTAMITLTGNSQSAGLVDAPNATAKITGGGDWFGAVIAQYITDMGGAAVHYDRRLLNEYFMVGNYMIHSFNWSKF